MECTSKCDFTLRSLRQIFPKFIELLSKIIRPLSQNKYNQFVDILREKGIHVETGVFGAMMKVEIHNDGPVSIWIDSEEKSL